MKTLSMIAGTGLLMLGAFGSAQAQVSGTPNSPFPNAAPHEIRNINGIPCRTILNRESGARIPVQCAAPTGMIGMDPMTTGSILVNPPQPGAPLSGTPGSAFPDAAPHEVSIINGVPCRTVLIPGTNERVPVACVR